MAGRPCSLLSPVSPGSLAWPVPLGCYICLQSRLHRRVHYQLQRTVPRSEPVQRVRGRTALSLAVLSLLHVCHKLMSDLLLLKVLNPKKKGKKKKYINSGTVSTPAFTVGLVTGQSTVPPVFCQGDTAVVQSGIRIHLCGLHPRRVRCCFTTLIL